MITVNPHGMGDWLSTIGGLVGKLFGSGSSTLTVPTECMSFDYSTQMQCAQMKQAVNKGQMLPAQYSQWVQEQQTMSTIKKYAPYALAGVGVIVLVTLLKKS